MPNKSGNKFEDPLFHIDYIRRWAGMRITCPLGDPTPSTIHAQVVIACNQLEAYLKACPGPLPDEPRIVHIYG